MPWQILVGFCGNGDELTDHMKRWRKLIDFYLHVVMYSATQLRKISKYAVFCFY
jgi:hypothetical protein